MERVKYLRAKRGQIQRLFDDGMELFDDGMERWSAEGTKSSSRVWFLIELGWLSQMEFPASLDDRLSLLDRIQWRFHPLIYTPTTPAIKSSSDTIEALSCDGIDPDKSCVTILNGDTLIAADLLEHPLILILADDVSPGGNYRCIAGMQEESLFLRSALWRHLTTDLYPIEQDQAVYARDVPLLDGSTKSFIACPGLKMPKLVNGRLSAVDRDSLSRKVDLIMRVSRLNGHKNLVLGALGCGVWGNPAKDVAEVFKEVLDAHVGTYEHVIFAILGANCERFRDVFERS